MQVEFETRSALGDMIAVVSGAVLYFAMWFGIGSLLCWF